MDSQIVSQFIPILLILLLLTNTTEFIKFSHTIIGKLIAITILIFYIILDKTVGLLTCVLIILYYQCDFVENVLNQFNISESFDNVGINNVPDATTTTAEPGTGLFAYFPLSLLDKLGFTNYASIPTPPDAITEFRKRNCEENQLIHKGMNVKDENIDLIFPELKFKNDKCNPCDKNCNFSIIEFKLNNEAELIPIDSNEYSDKQ